MIAQGNRIMETRLSIAPVLGAAMLAIAAAGLPAAAASIEPPVSHVRTAAADATSRFVALGIGKSLVVDLPADIKDVLVSNPQIANAVVRSARRAYLIGVTIGQTNIYFFDADGRQIAGFDIAVKRDLNGLRDALKQLLPDEDVKIEGVNDGVMLSGSVANAAEAQQAVDVATRLVGDISKVVNALTIRGRDQIMLKVTVAEVQRSVIKQLGINLSGSLGYGNSVINFNTSNPFSANGQALSSTAIGAQFGPSTGNSVAATLQAMERAGVLRTLAEPNLTAISGESASFLAGGEFPVPGGFVCDSTTHNCQIEVQFKKFGVGLNFTPVVLSGGRISLKVMSEVSEVTSDNELILQQAVSQGQNASVTIPGIKTRRAETTVEIPSGGSLAMAGMIQEQTKQQINGLPGLMQLPILGALFKSRDFINNTTELMVIVTPYLVHPVARKDLSLPDDGFADASDPATILLGRLNRIYGSAGHVEPHGGYFGQYGFIIE
jgi:pilus assembly protein CpaC